MQWFDDFFEARSRRAAQSISRRSAISRMGKLLVGTAFLLPILPFDRIGKAVAATKAKEKDKRNDDTACEYWRYCALDGFLCTCCQPLRLQFQRRRAARLEQGLRCMCADSSWPAAPCC
jgi:methylamine dehydrogenase light chain